MTESSGAKSLFDSKAASRVPLVRRQMPAREPVAAPSAPRRGWNSGLAAAVFAILALAPLPIASNRPVFWAVWAVTLGGLSCVYGLLTILSAAPMRAPVRRVLPEALLFSGLLLFTLAQVTHIGPWPTADLAYLPQLDSVLATISVDPGSTWLTLMQWATFGALFLLTLQFSTREKRAQKFLLAVLFVITGYGAFGLISLQLGDTILGFEKLSYQGFATGTFINRNSFATFLASGLAIGFAFLLNLVARRGEQTLGSWIGQVFAILLALATLAAALFATGSRMGLLSATVGILATGLAVALSQRRAAGPALWLVVVGMLLGAVLIVAFGEQLLDRLIFLQDDGGGRDTLHQQVWQAILARPLVGYGGGSFATIAGLVLGPPLSGAVVWEYTHSTYLALWFEYGLVVGSIPLVIVAMCVLRMARYLLQGSRRVIVPAALGVVSAFACHSLLDFSAEMEANAFLLTSILALAAAPPSRRTSAVPDLPVGDR